MFSRNQIIVLGLKSQLVVSLLDNKKCFKTLNFFTGGYMGSLSLF